MVCLGGCLSKGIIAMVGKLERNRLFSPKGDLGNGLNIAVPLAVPIYRVKRG